MEVNISELIKSTDESYQIIDNQKIKCCICNEDFNKDYCLMPDCKQS